MARAAKSKRYSSKPCVTSVSVRCSWLVIQRSTEDSMTGFDSSCPQSLPSQFIRTKRVAFHSLLQKLRYPSQRERSKFSVFAKVASDAKVKRTASAPKDGMPVG